MGPARHVVVVGLVATSVLVATGTGGFTTTVAERPVEIAVAEDEDAFLGVSDENLHCGNPHENTVLQNRFRTTLERIEIIATVPRGSRDGLRVDGSRLDPGDSTTIVFDGAGSSGRGYEPGTGPGLRVNPLGNESADTLRIEVIEARGVGVEVSLVERTFTVDCPRRARARNGNGSDRAE
ncbi:hypothetical protein [Haloplanus pelagicus]|jgi:hypothetical protein|uniref:hypothetical protein n=1 Tax=Haloplanus pelagicus TaxID=2949995 RepID=UPI002041C2AE|nr:hypothetical protein [Haloplanus sp. HW8-1]